MSLFKRRSEKDDAKEQVQKARDKVGDALADMNRLLEKIDRNTEIALEALRAGRQDGSTNPG